MSDNLDELTEEYENQKLADARKKGIKFPHGKFCYCGCRRELNKYGQPVKRGGMYA